MKLFKCQSCQQILYFENSVCIKCGHWLGYVPEIATVSALEPAGEPDGDQWRALAAPDTAYRFCANAAQKACSWLVEASSPESFASRGWTTAWVAWSCWPRPTARRTG
jgi:hypothetical protein